MEPDAAALRTEHDAVLSRLSSRASTRHLAWGLGLSFACATLLAAAAKLWWDLSEYHPELYLAVLTVAVFVGAAAGYRLGVGILLAARERHEFGRLLQLRSRIGLDDASSLLPSR
jgi:hypothetical protein